MSRVAVFRREHFNAAHRLHNPALSAEENVRIFGKCNSPNFHGHNYEIVVRVTGETDPVSGYVIDLGVLSDLIDVEVGGRFDHKNLNLDVEDFRDLNPTAENIVVVAYDRLRRCLPADLDLQVTLYETARNWVQFPADGGVV